MEKKPILPPTYFWIATFIAVAFHFALPIVTIIHYPWSFLGFIPILFGAVLNIWADQIFKRCSTTVKPFETPSVLVTDGPFALSRHPMYLGMVAIILGVSVICGSLTSFLGPAFFWVIVRVRFIPVEEHSMMETFGTDYAEYSKKVHRWV